MLQYGDERGGEKNFKTLTFIIVCIILSMIATIPITVDYTLGVAGVYSLIIGILLENAAVLILWQAGYTIFDILEQKGIGNASLYRRINQISLTDENNGTLVRQQAELFEYCPLFRKREKIAHVVLLLVTAYMVSICVIEMITYELDRFNLSQTDQIIFFAEWVIILFFTYTNISFYFDRGNIVRHVLGVSAGAAAVFAIYNIGRLIYIHVRAIPFDYDDFLFTYMMLSAANTVCICVIRKERERRAGHLLSVCFEEKPIP